MGELVIQGALAAILLIGMVGVIVIELYRGQPVSVPDALTLAVGTVVGFFFGARSVRSGSQSANETVRAVREEPGKSPSSPTAGPGGSTGGPTA